MQKSILVIAVVSGFLQNFEMGNIQILQQMGYEVHYAANFSHPVYACDRAVLEKTGIHCHSIPVQKSPLHLLQNAKALKQLKRLMKEFRIQAIHCHNPVGGLIGRVAGIGGYCIYTAHGFHFFKGAPIQNWLCFYPVERLLARLTDQLICINREDAQRAEQFHLKKGGAVHQIPGTGVNRNRFRKPLPEERSKARKIFSLEDDDFVFLSAGELNENKNHETAIRALHSIRYSHVKYLICGEGPRRGELERLIRKLGLENRVFLKGYQKEIEQCYWCADCFIFPSIREGLGMAALEAMACGLPLIVADNRGSREYMGENTIVCEAKNQSQYAEAMERISSDERLRERMSREGCRIVEDFSQEKTEALMKRIYEQMDRTLERRK